MIVRAIPLPLAVILLSGCFHTTIPSTPIPSTPTPELPNTDHAIPPSATYNSECNGLAIEIHDARSNPINRVIDLDQHSHLIVRFVNNSNKPIQLYDKCDRLVANCLTFQLVDETGTICGSFEPNIPEAFLSDHPEDVVVAPGDFHFADVYLTGLFWKRPTDLRKKLKSNTDYFLVAKCECSNGNQFDTPNSWIGTAYSVPSRISPQARDDSALD